MNSISFHLMLNHVPIFACLGGIPILAYGLVRNHDILKKLGLGLFVLAGIVVIPVFWTGQEAEELVEHLPGVLENLIEAHEEWAEVTLWAVIGLGLASVAALWAEFKQKTWKSIMLPAVSFSAFVVVALMLRTAHLGGQIRHSEIQTAQATREYHAESQGLDMQERKELNPSKPQKTTSTHSQNQENPFSSKELHHEKEHKEFESPHDEEKQEASKREYEKKDERREYESHKEEHEKRHDD